MKRLLPYEFVKNQFEKENCILLFDEYKNTQQKLEYICTKGHHHNISWSSWQQGHRCSYCAGNMKLTIEFVRKEFEKEGYKLLTSVYKNSRQKLEYICSNGHQHNISWHDWESSNRCPYCYGNVKLTIEFIRSKFKKEDYVLLTKNYKNCAQKLEYICPKGHKHSISWNNWRAGKRCGVCKMFRGNSNQHGCWKGGISCEPYCFEWSSKEFKDFIKERDGNICLNPDCWGTSKRLTIHHIDYDKKNCNPQNLITLCNSCNVRANKDREWHKVWYKAIINKRYNL